MKRRRGETEERSADKLRSDWQQQNPSERPNTPRLLFLDQLVLRKQLTVRLLTLAGCSKADRLTQRWRRRDTPSDAAAHRWMVANVR